jgi:imidazolonepropionase-like amidohydrolase
MKRNNAFLSPTQGFGLRGVIPGAQPWFEDPLFIEAVPAATLERYRRQAAAQVPAPDAPNLDTRLARVAPMIKVLLDGGVRIVVGTDAGAGPDYPPGYPVHREMELYTRIGMTPDQVIIAATKNGAEALQIDRDLGTLEAGKLANLLVLNGDPRADIRNTRRIDRVYLAGKALDRAAMRARWK